MNKQLQQLTNYMEDHPKERFFQAVRNFSEFNYIYGGNQITNDNKLEDLFYAK